MRSYLMAEFWIFFLNGKTWEFLIQFTIALWFNTFLVLSSHDFEEFEQHSATYREDWGVYQVENSHDLAIVFNKWLDVLFSAGLSSHRAHHLLPFQTSGFSNIVSESVIKELLPEYGLEWIAPKNFWTHRVPVVFHFCFLYPTRGVDPKTPFWEEQFSYEGFKKLVRYMVKGFVGIGSI